MAVDQRPAMHALVQWVIVRQSSCLPRECSSTSIIGMPVALTRENDPTTLKLKLKQGYQCLANSVFGINIYDGLSVILMRQQWSTDTKPMHQRWHDRTVTPCQTSLLYVLCAHMEVDGHYKQYGHDRYEPVRSLAHCDDALKSRSTNARWRRIQHGHENVEMVIVDAGGQFHWSGPKSMNGTIQGLR